MGPGRESVSVGTQTVEHKIISCPKHQPPKDERGLVDLDEDTLAWLASTELKVLGHMPEYEEVAHTTVSDWTQRTAHQKSPKDSSNGRQFKSQTYK